MTFSQGSSRGFSRGHALIVGIGNYSKGKLPANSANSAALRLADGLVGASGGYPVGQVRLLLDAAATRSNILDALNDLARHTGPEDVVFLYFNGLAGYDDRESYHFLPFDTGPLSNAAFDPPAGAQVGIGMVELLRLLSAIRCRHVFIVFDVPVVSGAPGALANLSAFHLERMQPETALAILATGEGRILLLPPTTPPDPSSRLTLFSRLLIRGLAEQRVPASPRTLDVLALYQMIYQGCVPAGTLDGEFGDWAPELALVSGTRPFEIAGPDGGMENASVPEAPDVVDPAPLELPPLPGLRVIDPAWARDALEKQTRQLHSSARAEPPAADREDQARDGLEASFGLEPEVAGAKGAASAEPATAAGEPTASEALPQSDGNTGTLRPPAGAEINTGGGAVIGGSVSVGGDFVGRDQINGPVTQIYGTQINQITVQPTPAEPSITGILSLRLDAAVPAQVFVGESFRLAVAIRLPTSAPLAVSGLPQTFADEFPALKLEAQPFLKLRLQVQASDSYRVVGEAYHDVIYIIGRDSPTFYFELEMQRSGQVDIIIEVLQDLGSLGSARVLANVQSGRAPGGQVVATVESQP